jgi:hypothetical protein
MIAPAGAAGGDEPMLDPQMLGHRGQLTALMGLDERDADAGAARSPGTPHAVDVRLVVRGGIEVDDV